MRLPAPLVLLLGGAMVAAGIFFAWIGGGGEDRPSPAPAAELEGAPTPVRRELATPEETAETFLDAWRKRDHALALELATGPAEQAVRARMRRDEALDPEETEIRSVWNAMASTRLAIRVERRQAEGEGRITLRTVAEGTFLDQAYARRVRFSIRAAGARWKVEAMELLEVLEGPEGLPGSPER
ncbi:MAG: hypothetical protein OEY14_14860 [Myxococcales bacterium]|nr:hypothetical protein [Myxococcales bacterium]